MGPKPSLGSTAGITSGTTTRTSPTDDGAWQTGDVIRATITFYTDADGTAPSASAPVIQTLTYIAATPGTTGGGCWESAPVPIATDTRSMTATYQYLPTADPMTATSEQIACHVSQARGTAITPDADGKLLIPIANVSGTLSLSVDFKRTSALVSVLIQPGQAVVLTTKYSQSSPGTPASDGTYTYYADNSTAAREATAHFHLTAPDAPAAPAIAAAADQQPAAAFTLRFDARVHPNPAPALNYTDVPYCAGWKYSLDARKIEGNGLAPLDPEVYNAENPVWTVTGGGTPEADATVCANVKERLKTMPRGALNSR